MYDTGIMIVQTDIQVGADETAGQKGHIEFRISALGGRGDSDGNLFGERNGNYQFTFF